MLNHNTRKIIKYTVSFYILNMCQTIVQKLPCVEGRLCSAESYTKHPTIGYFHPIQTYYFGKLLEKESTPTEADHHLCWIEYDQLKGKMFVEMQNWALEQLFINYNTVFCKNL